MNFRKYILMGLFSFLFACEKAENIYVYGTDDFIQKEKK